MYDACPSYLANKNLEHDGSACLSFGLVHIHFLLHVLELHNKSHQVIVSCTITCERTPNIVVLAMSMLCSDTYCSL